MFSTSSRIVSQLRAFCFHLSAVAAASWGPGGFFLWAGHLPIAVIEVDLASLYASILVSKLTMDLTVPWFVMRIIVECLANLSACPLRCLRSS